MKKLVLFLLLSSISLSGFAIVDMSNNQINTIEFNESIEVYINKKGKILADGKKVSIEDLDKLIKELKSKNGVLKYAIASTESKKAKKAYTEFFKLIRKHRITLKLYTNDTFTKELTY